MLKTHTFGVKSVVGKKLSFTHELRNRYTLRCQSEDSSYCWGVRREGAVTGRDLRGSAKLATLHFSTRFMVTSECSLCGKWSGCRVMVVYFSVYVTASKNVC